MSPYATVGGLAHYGSAIHNSSAAATAAHAYTAALQSALVAARTTYNNIVGAHAIELQRAGALVNSSPAYGPALATAIPSYAPHPYGQSPQSIYEAYIQSLHPGVMPSITHPANQLPQCISAITPPPALSSALSNHNLIYASPSIRSPTSTTAITAAGATYSPTHILQNETTTPATMITGEPGYTTGYGPY